mgnify:FL=1
MGIGTTLGFRLVELATMETVTTEEGESFPLEVTLA